MSNLIKIKNLTKKYVIGDNTIYALNNVNINIKKGEFISIIGPSGSGKSTLLNLIGGIDQPTSGVLEINGNDVFKLEGNELSKFRFYMVGFIFQSFNLISSLNVLENVTLPTIPYKIDLRKRGEQLLFFVGLSDRIKQLPTQLSGGQKQRVAIARSLINNPKILLADEPTGELDTKTGEDVINLLKSINSKNKTTIILVTHDLQIAKRADRIIHLKDGKIVLDKLSSKVSIKELLG